MLQVFYLDVTYVALAIYVCCKCLICLQMYVASALSGCYICCSARTHKAYVVNISSVLDVCYNKYFILQVFHEQARHEDAGEDGPLGCNGPDMRTGSEASAIAGGEHKAVSMGMAAGAEHEAASMGG
jgi:hypothetical protein